MIDDIAFSARNIKPSARRVKSLSRAILSTLQTCVDAGAHEGSWTKSLLRHFKPKHVIAV